MADFVAYAKQRPAQLNYASTGPGTQGHLQSAMFAATAGIHATHVPYKDAGRIFAAFQRNDVSFMFYPHASLRPMLQSGRVKVLASTGENRSSNTPDVPTMIEAGYPDVTLAAWNAIYAPAGTPAAVVERLSAATQRVLEAPEMKIKLLEMGGEIAFLSPRALAEFTRTEIERYRRLVAITGIKIE